jgi:hypothetical protein
VFHLSCSISASDEPDQPSTVLAGFADPAIAGLGADLDRQLGALLGALGVEANQVLGAADPAGARSA